MQTASFYHMLSVIYLLIIARTIVLVQIDFLFQFVLNHDILQELSNLQQEGGEFHGSNFYFISCLCHSRRS